MSGVPSGLVRLIASRITYKVTQWAAGSGISEDWQDDREEARLFESNVVTSKRQDGDTHALLLDLDVPAYLIPSSTPGHSHLYVDVEMSKRQLYDVLDVLAEAGVIEKGYAAVSKKRGATSLRLPWIRK